MKQSKSIAHDMALFAKLLDKGLGFDERVRKGQMFGCPAVFHGRKMALCVMGTHIGLKVPAETAASARQHPDITDFCPYGKAPMREWIQIPGTIDALSNHSDLILEAILYAERLDAK